MYTNSVQKSSPVRSFTLWAMDRDRDRSTKFLIPQKMDQTAQDCFLLVLNQSGPVLGPHQS